MASDWIQLEEAWRLMEAHTPHLDSETVPLEQVCGRVLAQPLQADRDYPPFARAAMDGFAVRCADVQQATADAPVHLQVVGESLPGQAFTGAWRAGTAVRIMTGAPVPDGWDAIVPVEHTSGFATDPVGLRRGAVSGDNIAPLGCERRAGEPVYAAGRRLLATDVAALAMLGVTQVDVGRRPQVAVLATGNELVPSEQTPARTQIRDSNTPLLTALVSTDAHVHSLGRSPDVPGELAVRLARGLLSDVLLLTGGVSMGAYDVVEEGLEAAGVVVHFRRVAIQPGKPVLFGTHAGGAVLALPGNPVSALTTCRLFALPLLRRMQGMGETRPRWSRCTARFRWARRSERCLFLPGRRVEGGEAVERVPYTGSGDLLAYGASDCQIVLPRKMRQVAPGDSVPIWPL